MTKEEAIQIATKFTKTIPDLGEIAQASHAVLVPANLSGTSRDVWSVAFPYITHGYIDCPGSLVLDVDIETKEVSIFPSV